MGASYLWMVTSFYVSSCERKSSVGHCHRKIEKDEVYFQNLYSRHSHL